MFKAIIASLSDIMRPMFWGYVLRAICMTIGALVLTIVTVLILTVVVTSFINMSDFSNNTYVSSTYILLEDWNILPYFFGSLWGVFGIGIVFGSFFVFPVLLTAIVGLYSDDIALTLESDNGYKKGKPTKFITGIYGSFKLILTLIGVNILALPVYAIFWFIAPIIYMVINGYFFGREYFEMVGYRHLTIKQMKKFRKDNFGEVLLVGMFFVFMITIPFLNLILPIIMVSLTTHLIGRKNSIHRL